MPKHGRIGLRKSTLNQTWTHSDYSPEACQFKFILTGFNNVVLQFPQDPCTNCCQ